MARLICNSTCRNNFICIGVKYSKNISTLDGCWASCHVALFYTGSWQTTVESALFDSVKRNYGQPENKFKEKLQEIFM